MDNNFFVKNNYRVIFCLLLLLLVTLNYNLYMSIEFQLRKKGENNLRFELRRRDLSSGSQICCYTLAQVWRHEFSGTDIIADLRNWPEIFYVSLVLNLETVVSDLTNHLRLTLFQGTSMFTNFTKLCKGLALVLVVGHLVVQFIPATVPYLALIPARYFVSSHLLF